MSETATPINPARFAAALKDLTVASLYAKAAEIRNSVAHLKRSNNEMQPFVDEGDKEFAGYVWENLAVIRRHEERLDLLKAEIEERGLMWHTESAGEPQPGQLSPPSEQEDHGPSTEDAHRISTTSSTAARGLSGGSLDDNELARRLAQRMEEDEDIEGVHL